MFISIQTVIVYVVLLNIQSTFYYSWSTANENPQVYLASIDIMEDKHIPLPTGERRRTGVLCSSVKVTQDLVPGLSINQGADQSGRGGVLITDHILSTSDQLLLTWSMAINSRDTVKERTPCRDRGIIKRWQIPFHRHWAPKRPGCSLCDWGHPWWSNSCSPSSPGPETRPGAHSRGCAALGGCCCCCCGFHPVHGVAFWLLCPGHQWSCH